MSPSRLARLVAAVSFTLGVAACSGNAGPAASSGASGDSGTGGAGGGGAFACPKVGDHACPNDQATTQSDVDVCTACFTEWEALSRCAQGAPGGCGADGKKSGEVPAACGTAYADYLKCAFGTAVHDGGAG